MVSVVSSVKNEEAIIPLLLERMVAVLERYGEYEIILIDNGSADATALVIEQHHKKNPRIKLVSLSRDFSQAIALRAGFDFARGDIVVMMDGDLQDLPEEIPKLISKLDEGFDLAYGLRENRHDTFFRKVASTTIKKILSYVIRRSDMPLADDRMLVGVFRAMKKEVADAIRSLPEHTAYIQGLVRWLGFRQGVVRVEHGKRHAGKSKYSLKNLFWYALEGIVSSSAYPLRFTALVGFLLAFLSFIGGLWEIFYRLHYGTQLLGFTTLIFVILFLGGVELFILGVVGEYIGRIYIETKQRPLYIVKRKLL